MLVKETCFEYLLVKKIIKCAGDYIAMESALVAADCPVLTCSISVRRKERWGKWRQPGTTIKTSLRIRRSYLPTIHEQSCLNMEYVYWQWVSKASIRFRVINCAGLPSIWMSFYHMHQLSVFKERATAVWWRRIRKQVFSYLLKRRQYQNQRNLWWGDRAFRSIMKQPLPHRS